MGFELLDNVERSLAAERVSIVEFAESDEYCNRPLYPRQRVMLKTWFLEELEPWEEDILDYMIKGGARGTEVKVSPNIRERVQYLRDEGYSHFREIVLVGGRRSSKGFMTGLALSYVMWNTLQLQDPGTHYGIDPTKEIYFACIAGSEAQAKEYQFADFTNTVETCTAFEPYIANALETELRVSTPVDLAQRAHQMRTGRRVTKDIARLRGKAWAANAGTLRGSATMALCIDEAAHMLAGETKASADEVYKAAIPATGQFGPDAMIFVNSSPYSKVGLFYERYTEAMNDWNSDYEPGAPLDDDRVNGNPLIATFQFPSWFLFDGYQGYTSSRGHTFDHALEVSADWDPTDKKWKPQERAAIRQQKAEQASNPETYKVERRAHFAEVTDAYLNSVMVDRIFLGKPVGYETDVEGNQNIVLQRYESNIANAINLNEYKFHLDPSSTTAGFGFAIAHVERFPDPDNAEIDHVIFDLVKRWNPKDFPGETIDWKIIINEILFYAEIYRPFEITFDQFQSADPIQTLNYKLMEKGIGGVRVHVRQPTNTDQWYQWENFKTAINHGLVHAPHDALMIEPYGPDEELKFLQKKNTGGKAPRVDKQEIGPVQTKDMADCMADCVHSLIGNVIAHQVRQRAINAVTALGSRGGYPIGGHGDHARPPLSELHPDLASWYPGRRTGEQSLPGGALSEIPGRGSLGRGVARGMNRGRQRSRGRW